MDQRIDVLTHANQQAHDAIGLRIDNLRGELGGRIDAQGSELRARIDAQGAALRNELGGRLERVEVKLARVSEDVAFIKGRTTAQPDD